MPIQRLFLPVVGGVQGKTSEADTPNIGDGGDATDDNPYKPDGGYEIW